MRFKEGIERGAVTVTFRRWKRRQVVAGNRYRTPVGLIDVDAVDIVTVDRITKVDARRAGYPSREALIADLRGTPDLDLYRVRFHHVAAVDPRDALAATDALTEDDRLDISRRLDRLDAASRVGPWTRSFLALIAERPAIRAPDLAASIGWETAPFKLNVRKLKNLGLTISLERGYRLSPRGSAYVGVAAQRNPTLPAVESGVVDWREATR